MSDFSIGQFQVVVINRGKNHNLTPGAVLAIDQKGEIVHDKYGKAFEKACSGAFPSSTKADPKRFRV